jgi:uncharacterized protein (DUF362 family)/Pyruvate/2-oxoacid:ferredoxin oxidoreductase delta subunit
MDSIKPAVALLRCDSYDASLLDSVLASAADIAGFPDLRDKRVLIKPNILSGSAPGKAVTTNPEFIAALIRLVRSRGASRIMVGDSPGWQQGMAAAKTCGIYQATVANGAEWVEFSPGKPRPSPSGKLIKSFVLASVLDECDLVVNASKLKNHRLMTYTGAVKNLFGLTPGFAKAGMHQRFPNKADFGTMLVDLAESVPCFTFMDGIVAMEGEGPGNGDPFLARIVLAAQKPALLDWAASQCLGYDPRRIPYLADAFARAGGDPENLALFTAPESVSSVTAANFKRLHYDSGNSALLGEIPAFIRKILGRFTIDRPIFLPDPCIGCSACVRICPVHALALGKDKNLKNRVRIDDSACITCFCCHEVCPAKAIAIGKVPFRLMEARKIHERP